MNDDSAVLVEGVVVDLDTAGAGPVAVVSVLLDGALR
jgi:hypothetical protein